MFPASLDAYATLSPVGDQVGEKASPLPAETAVGVDSVEVEGCEGTTGNSDDLFPTNSSRE